MDIALFAPQGAHCHVDVIYKGSKGLMMLRVRPTPTPFLLPMSRLQTVNSELKLRKSHPLFLRMRL